MKKGTSEGGKKTLFPFFFRGQKISTFSCPLQRKLCTFKATHDGRCGKLNICSLCPEQREEQERERGMKERERERREWRDASNSLDVEKLNLLSQPRPPPHHHTTTPNKTAPQGRDAPLRGVPDVAQKPSGGHRDARAGRGAQSGGGEE